MAPQLITYIHLMLISLLVLFSIGCTRDINDTPVEFEEISSEYDPKMSDTELEAFKNKAISTLVQKYKTPSQLKRGEIEVINLSANTPCLNIPEKIEPSKLGPKTSADAKNYKKVDQYSQLKIKPEETKGSTHKVPPNIVKPPQKGLTSPYTLPVKGKYTLVDVKKPENGIKVSADSNSSVSSIADGKVIFVGSIKGLGKVVLIEHAEQIIAAYANVSDILVRIHQTVEKGQKIGTVPTTPSKKAEIHFELRKGSKRLNPLDRLPNTSQ